MGLFLPAVLAVVLLTGAAGAEQETVATFMNGETLLAMCDRVEGTHQCTGYIAGVADALALARGDTATALRDGRPACRRPCLTAR